MNRLPRHQQVPGTIYHLMHRGNNKHQLFQDEEDLDAFTCMLRKKKLASEVKMYHEVVMPNHLHAQVEPLSVGALSRFVQRLCGSYAIYFHKKYATVGHVWQPHSKIIPIETDEYFLRCARYIELNPVRAGIVQHPNEYKWSSYRHSVGTEHMDWLDDHLLLTDLISREGTAGYEMFVNEGLNLARQGSGEKFSKEPIYGSAAFKKRFD